jgi:hypothetical protein
MAMAVSSRLRCLVEFPVPGGVRWITFRCIGRSWVASGNHRKRPGRAANGSLIGHLWPAHDLAPATRRPADPNRLQHHQPVGAWAGTRHPRASCWQRRWQPGRLVVGNLVSALPSPARNSRWPGSCWRRPARWPPRDQHCLLAARAVLEEARAGLEEAARLHAEAAERWRSFGVVLEHGHAPLGLGRCLARLGRPEAPDRLLKAHAIFELLDARRLLAETDGWLRQLPRRPGVGR